MPDITHRMLPYAYHKAQGGRHNWLKSHADHLVSGIKPSLTILSTIQGPPKMLSYSHYKVNEIILFPSEGPGWLS